MFAIADRNALFAKDLMRLIKFFLNGLVVGLFDNFFVVIDVAPVC